jgi:hypothetical protein
MKLRVVTCMRLPEPDTDQAPLAAALAAAGFDAELLAWDDPNADWTAPIPTIIRSPWNYALHLDAFLAWLDRTGGPIWNPRDVVHDNVHKRYLLDLAARGVAVVPTAIVERGQRATVRERSVIKPEVGGGSLDTHVFEPGDPGIDAHVAHIHTRCAALVQPYVQSVHDYGERSLVWIDGELTHAIRKTPRFSGDAERVEGPFPIADDERALAMAALAPYVDRILYGRVDIAHDDVARPMVMELELVEPSLFFARHPPALDRYIAGLAARMRA